MTGPTCRTATASRCRCSKRYDRRNRVRPHRPLHPARAPGLGQRIASRSRKRPPRRTQRLPPARPRPQAFGACPLRTRAKSPARSLPRDDCALPDASVFATYPRGLLSDGSRSLGADDETTASDESRQRASPRSWATRHCRVAWNSITGVALLPLPHCDSDGAQAASHREVAGVEVVPRHRMHRIRASGACVARPLPERTSYRADARSSRIGERARRAAL
jgi:hypothetical protein